MTYLLVSLAAFAAFASWRAGTSLRRLWSALPDRNIDFDLTAEDLGTEHRS